jgi:nicotinamide-nucleotide amidase
MWLGIPSPHPTSDQVVNGYDTRREDGWEAARVRDEADLAGRTEIGETLVFSRMAEMIFSGDELLRGDTLNTNQSYLGERLLDLGYLVTHALCVADDLFTMVGAIKASLARQPALLVLSGGLGPTEDDLTREAVATALGLPLEHHDDLLEAIRARFASRGLVMSDANRKQASIPPGATVLSFSGTAPGFALKAGATLLAALPGVPWELKDMWENQVEPLLPAHSGFAGGTVVAGASADPPAISRGSDLVAAHEVRRLRIFGVGESVVAQKLTDLDWRDPLATIGTRANLDGITVILRGRATPQSRSRLDALQERVGREWGGQLYSLTNEDLQAVVAGLLRASHLTVAVAESCTGGLLGKRCTDIPGSSDYFLGGVIAYENRVKTALLGVPARLLADKGAVSEEVAAAMAEGACRALGSDCGLSITGIAGPGGGSEEKPVGLVYIGSVVAGVTRVERFRLFGGRDQVRERATFAALDLLRRRLLA